MSAMWWYFWPVFAIGLVCGAFAGWWFHRGWRLRPGGDFRRRQWRSYAAGLIAALAVTALWHSLGAADRLTDSIERPARTTLDHYELPLIEAEVQQGPVRRRLLLSGPADAFQRGELVRIMNGIPGVSGVAWSDGRRSTIVLPLLFEAAVLALISFIVGLLLALVAESRRQANAEWRW